MKTLALITLMLSIPLTGLMAAEATSDPMPSDAETLALEQQVKQLVNENQDYKAALTAYATAARANPTQMYYRNQFALLRNVTKMQKALATEPVAEKWQGYAEAVRNYLYGKGFYQAALVVDTAAYEKFSDVSSGSKKLETLLMLSKNDEAAALAQGLEATETSTRLATLKPVALACSGKVEQAVAAIEPLTINANKDPYALFDLARISQAAGKQDEAYSYLKLFLEHTVPSEMGMSRNMIDLCKDFSGLHDQEAYATVLATESKVEQSSCSGGSSCSSCSLKGKCSSSH